MSKKSKMARLRRNKHRLIKWTKRKWLRLCTSGTLKPIKTKKPIQRRRKCSRLSHQLEKKMAHKSLRTRTTRKLKNHKNRSERKNSSAPTEILTSTCFATQRTPTRSMISANFGRTTSTSLKVEKMTPGKTTPGKRLKTTSTLWAMRKLNIPSNLHTSVISTLKNLRK